MSVYLTGDIHGNPERFKQLQLEAEDIIIVLGDFGMPWNNDDEGLKWLDWLKMQPYTVLFVDGNHEDFDLLNAYPVTQLYSGKVHKLANNIFHLMRGEIFTIAEKNFFCFGGASSVDRWWRTEHETWWREENFNDDEQENALCHLESYGYKVDYVLTHTAPSKFSEQIQGDKQHFDYCPTADLLGVFEEKLEYRKWYFGHFHVDLEIGKAMCLYKKVIKL